MRRLFVSLLALPIAALVLCIPVDAQPGKVTGTVSMECHRMDLRRSI